MNRGQPAPEVSGSPVDALVVDVHIRSSVAGLRGLGRAGVAALTVGPTQTSAGRWSRYATGAPVLPDPAADRRGFVTELARLARERGPFFAYPGREEGIEAILDAEASEPLVHAPFPRAALQQLRCKPALADLAAEVNLGTPHTVAEGTAAELSRHPPSLPCAVKSVEPIGALKSTRVVETRRELQELLNVIEPETPLFVQERIRGPLLSVGLIVSREGQLCASFQHVARRTWPPRAGSTALAVSVSPDESLIRRSARLLSESGYWGLVEMEYLASSRGPVLIDVNTRFYGCLALPLACGVNLPAIWHATARGDRVPTPGPYRCGVTYRWLEADLAALAHGTPQRLVQRPARPAVGPMWASDDPLPGPLLMATALNGRRRKWLSALSRRPDPQRRPDAAAPSASARRGMP